MSADSILFSPAFAIVQHSAPYVRTVHTCERTNFIFRSLFILLSLQIGTIDRALSSWPFQFGTWCLCCNCHQLIFSNLIYLKCSTTSICSSSTIIPASDCIFPIFRSLVCFIFNFSSIAIRGPTMLLNFLICLSPSSCDCTKCGIVCVSQRIRAQFSPILITISSISACRISDSVHKLKRCVEKYATLPHSSPNRECTTVAFIPYHVS